MNLKPPENKAGELQINERGNQRKPEASLIIQWELIAILVLF